MKKVFCIMGKSASGKDTILTHLKVQLPQLVPIVAYTTRPIRANEEDGVDYNFISMEQMNTMDKNGELLERRDYETTEDKWSYAINVHSFDDETKDYIMITTPSVFGKIREELWDFDFIPIYITLDDYTRLKRSIDRVGPDKNYEEICRRFLSDKKDFDEKILKKLGITNQFNNLYPCEDVVFNFIANQLMQPNQKKGHWSALTECSNEGIYCSNCNKKVYKLMYANQKIDSNYCPNCGAKMKKGIEIL